MLYPSGKIVSRGDLVWWNGGKGVGVIVEIYDREEAISLLGIEESCVEIYNDINIINRVNNGIIYPERSFLVDGIEKLSPDEEIEVRKNPELYLK